MKAISVAWGICIICVFLGETSFATVDKPTSLSAAQHAIDANLRTHEGKVFDDKIDKNSSITTWFRFDPASN